jgi:hypothetical protein
MALTAAIPIFILCIIQKDTICLQIHPVRCPFPAVHHPAVHQPPVGITTVQISYTMSFLTTQSIISP